MLCRQRVIQFGTHVENVCTSKELSFTHLLLKMVNSSCRSESSCSIRGHLGNCYRMKQYSDIEMVQNCVDVDVDVDVPPVLVSVLEGGSWGQGRPPVVGPGQLQVTFSLLSPPSSASPQHTTTTVNTRHHSQHQSTPDINRSLSLSTSARQLSLSSLPWNDGTLVVRTSDVGENVRTCRKLDPVDIF